MFGSTGGQARCELPKELQVPRVHEVIVEHSFYGGSGISHPLWLQQRAPIYGRVEECRRLRLPLGLARRSERRHLRSRLKNLE